MSITTESLICVSADRKSVNYNNTNIIDVEYIFQKTLIYVNEHDIKNIDSQKIFLNYFIIEVCEQLKKNSDIKYIMYLNDTLPSVNEDEKLIYIKLIEKSLRALSLPYIRASRNLDIFYKRLLARYDDELISFEREVMNSAKKTTSKRLMNFLTRNGLTYLHNTYFKNPSNKLILFR